MNHSAATASILDRITTNSSEIKPKQAIRIVKSRNAKRPPPKKINSSQNSANSTSQLPTFGAEWSIVANSIEPILLGTGEGAYEPAYQAIERLCHSEANLPLINEKLLEELKLFPTTICKRFSPPVTLVSIISTWEEINRITTILPSIFCIFERSYLFPTTLDKICMENLREVLHQNSTYVDSICSAIVSEVDQERHKYMKNDMDIASVSPSINQAAHIIVSLSLIDDILPHIKAETTNFFSNLPSDDSQISNFLRYAKITVDKDISLLAAFPQDIRVAVIKVTRECLYINKLISNFSTIITQIVDAKNYPTLRLLASLVNEANDVKISNAFVNALSSDITRRVQDAFKLKNIAVITELLELQTSFMNCMQELDHKSGEAVMRAFKHALNESSFRCAFLLAKYVHTKIQSSSTEFLELVDKIFHLFRELESMDAFIKHYQQFLAIRLLACTKAPPKIESDMVVKLCRLFGEEGLEPMQKMITDTASSFEVNNEFDPETPFKMRFFLMSYDSWPVFPQVNLRLPTDVLDAKSRFASFYKRKQERRQLKWLSQLDECTFRLNNDFISGSAMYFLVVESVVNDTVITDSGLDEENANAIVEVLVKNKVLKKEKSTGALALGKPQKKKINLPLPAVLAPKQLKDKTMEEVFAVRKTKIEAAIMLTMKRLKSAKDNELYIEMSSVINYPVSSEDFTKCVASLIEKAYLRRAEDSLSYAD